VNIYSVEGLDEELKMSANAFCEDDNNIYLDKRKNELQLSQIFQWYRVDFAQKNNDLPKAILGFLRRTKFQDLDKLLDASEKIKVSFKRYDWSTSAMNVKVFQPSSLKISNRVGLFGSRPSKTASDDSQHDEESESSPSLTVPSDEPEETIQCVHRFN
jgi:hypothetical protein